MKPFRTREISDRKYALGARLSEALSVQESWLPENSMPMEPKNASELNAIQARTKSVIEAALRESRGRVFGRSGAAAKLGIPRSTLESKIRSLKIDKSVATLPTVGGFAVQEIFADVGEGKAAARCSLGEPIEGCSHTLFG